MVDQEPHTDCRPITSMAGLKTNVKALAPGTYIPSRHNITVIPFSHGHLIVAILMQVVVYM